MDSKRRGFLRAFSLLYQILTLDKTIQYEYNGIGNITHVREYPYTPAGTELSGTPTTTTFAYNASKSDVLSQIGNQTVGFNANGGLSYYKRSYTWKDGKLKSFYRGSTMVPMSVYEECGYQYNAYGQRISKTYHYDPNTSISDDASYNYTKTYDYDHNGRLVREKIVQKHILEVTSTRDIFYLYDESGMVGFTYSVNGATPQAYYYQRNLQGDVIAIYDTNGAKVVEYAYDAWGNCTIVYSTNDTLANDNPIRYRGYYLDIENNFYYLNSRYYSPELRRFISPDDTAYLDPESVNGLNLYCYCGNDPVNFVDPSGHSLTAILTIIGLSIGVVAGLGYAAYTDYQDDYDINGSIGWQRYLGYSIIGGAIGAGIGFTIGYFGPTISSYFGGALSSIGGSQSLAIAGGGTSSAAMIGILGAMLAVGALVLFASNHRPGNNQAQNKQFENAVRKAGYNPKDPTIRDELQKIHRYIRNKKLDLGWKELVELIKEWLG